MLATCSSWLAGDRVKLLADNDIEASARRRQVLREVQTGALPGPSLVVSASVPDLGRDVLPCEDGHAQERSLLEFHHRTLFSAKW